MAGMNLRNEEGVVGLVLLGIIVVVLVAVVVRDVHQVRQGEAKPITERYDIPFVK